MISSKKSHHKGPSVWEALKAKKQRVKQGKPHHRRRGVRVNGTSASSSTQLLDTATDTVNSPATLKSVDYGTNIKESESTETTSDQSESASLLMETISNNDTSFHSLPSEFTHIAPLNEPAVMDVPIFITSPTPPSTPLLTNEDNEQINQSSFKRIIAMFIKVLKYLLNTRLGRYMAYFTAKTMYLPLWFIEWCCYWSLDKWFGTSWSGYIRDFYNNLNSL
ncbi:hypothetical protein BDF19DRAFT_411841 [Syncephalis fuscata]|nr:hypothetical protein BDF19DRAFT_411841 [Syncephalis fuscata]